VDKGDNDIFSGIGDVDQLLGYRQRLVGIYRVYGHAFLVLRVLRRREDRRWPWLVLAAAALPIDVLLAWRANSPTGPVVAERAALETLEAALWTRATGPLPSTTRGATLLAMPTAAEAGYLLGRRPGRITPSDAMRALLPVTSVVLGQGLSRKARGWVAGWGQIGWGIVGIAMGAAVGRNRRALRARYRETWREHAGPRVEAAFWCAQHDLSMDETDPTSPHNLKRDLMLLEAAGSDRARSARFRFSERKQEVVSITAPFGSYLGDLAVGRGLVPRDAWLIRLNPAQVLYLQNSLTTLDAGRTVGSLWDLRLLNDPEARRPGGPIALSYGPHFIDVPAAAPPVRWLADPAPVLFITSAAWKLLGRAFPEHPPFLIPLSAAMLDLLAAGAYKQGQPDISEGAKPTLVAFLSAALFVLPTSAWVRRRRIENNAEEQAFPMSAGIFGFTAIAARYWDDLDVRQRRLVVAGTGVLFGVMWYASAHPIDISGFLTEVLSGLLPLVLAGGAGGLLEADSEDVWGRLRQWSETVVAEAYRRGVDYELGLLGSIVDEASMGIDEQGLSLSDNDREIVQKHFQEAREWLLYRRHES
jgi:hypothetical protein